MPTRLKNNSNLVQEIGQMYYSETNLSVSKLSRVFFKDSNGIISEVFSSAPDSSNLYAVLNGITLAKLDNSLEIINQTSLPISPVGMCIDNSENIYLLSYISPSSGRYTHTVTKYNSNLTLVASKDFTVVWPSGTPQGTHLYPIQIMHNASTDSIFVEAYRPRVEESQLGGMAKISSDLTLVKTGAFFNQATGMSVYSSPYGIYRSTRYDGRDYVKATDLNVSKTLDVLQSYRWLSGGDNNLGYLNVTYATPYPNVADGMENFYEPQGIIASIRAPRDHRGCIAECKFYKSNNRDAIMHYNMPLGASGYCLTDRYTFSTVGIQPNDPFNGAFMGGAIDKYDMINIKSYTGNMITKYDKTFKPICSRTFGSVQFMDCL